MSIAVLAQVVCGAVGPPVAQKFWFTVLDGADPLNVIVTVLTVAAPAASTAKLIVARSSTAVLERPEAVPSAVPVTVSFVRSNLISLPPAPVAFTVIVIADVAFELLPKATTVSCRVSFVVSVDVPILKAWVVLSVPPDEA